MKPDDSTQGGGVQHYPQQAAPPPSQHDAATNIIRAQINTLFGDEPVASPQVPPAAPTASIAPTTATVQASPRSLQQQVAAETPRTVYHRTAGSHYQAHPQAEQWKTYHSAWQDYYQKYYAGYYAAQQAEQQKRAREAQLEAELAQPSPAQNSPSLAAMPQEALHTPADEALSKDQALLELRQKLLGTVRKQAKKMRASRHFMPIAAAALVVLVFVFIQYNRFFIGVVSAYVSPGAINPQNIIIDPSSDATVGPDPRLIIPKINVDVPVVYDTTPKHEDQMAAMDKGVAHFAIPGANSKPGEIGNTVFAGHSSNDVFDQGDYKFIFVQLEKLTVGDKIYANYQGKRYTYIVTKTETVKPTEVSKLVYPTDKPMMTLITCTPIGTALNRFLVTAEQVSPDPKAAQAAPEGSGDQAASDDSAMPGNSPTLLERLFGQR